MKPDTEAELEFDETTCAAISESKSKIGKRFKDVEKLVNDLQQFVENNSITEPNFTFNREECYAKTYYKSTN